MEFGGNYLLPADPETLWTALHDTELLERCVPGCERISWIGTDTLEAEIVLRLAAAKRRYRGRVRIADAQPYESYRLLFGASESGSSVAAVIHFEPQQDGTVFRYKVDARLDSYLARLGVPVAAAVARRIAGRFFRNMDTALVEYAATGTNPLRVRP